MTDSLIARMNKRRTVAEVLLAILVVVGLVFAVRWYSPDVPRSLQIQDTTILLEIADSAEERRVGLSGREFLEWGTGMLFVFQRPGYYAFWMPDMRFPIDIIWIDKYFSVVDMEKNVSPDTYPKRFQPSFEALYVLELNAGEADALGITEGSVFTPVFSD